MFLSWFLAYLQALEVEFNTGEAFRYPAELLRVESPAADAHRSVGLITPKIIHGRRHVGIMDVQPVGRYAVRIQFDDLHSAGIYTYPFLHELGVKKFARMRSYIKALKRAGLSRDPKTMKSRKEEIKV